MNAKYKSEKSKNEGALQTADSCERSSGQSQSGSNDSSQTGGYRGNRKTVATWFSMGVLFGLELALLIATLLIINPYCVPPR